MALEHAAEDPHAERLGGGQRGHRHHHPLERRRVATGEVVEVGVHADVAGEGEVDLAHRVPQRRVALVVVVGLSEFGREHGDLQGLGAERGHAVHLGDGGGDVGDGDLVVDDEATRIRRGELGEHVVERPGGFRDPFGHVADVAERRDLGVDDLDVDTVGGHVLQALVAVAVAGTCERRVLVARHRLHVHLGLRHVGGHGGGERLLGGVVGGVQPGGEVGLDLVLGHGHVRVGRDDPFAVAVQDDLGCGDGGGWCHGGLRSPVSSFRVVAGIGQVSRRPRMVPLRPAVTSTCRAPSIWLAAVPRN